MGHPSQIAAGLRDSALIAVTKQAVKKIMIEAPTMTIAELEARIVAIFRNAGMNTVQAEAAARVIAAAERDACKSHGIYRIEGVLRTIKFGKVTPDAMPEVEPHAAGSAIIRVNARGGFANPAFELGLPLLVERTIAFGLSALVINDCTHFSALWPEVEAVATNGLAAIVMCPSYATVAPTGGNKALLGTNPLAFGWPRTGRPPYVFDFATSVAARGEIELHRRAGTELPVGWAIDRNGSPTVKPDEALAGAMLPFGGHKGSAISTMVELLAGIMIGDLTSPEVLEYLGSTVLAPRHGELVLAFSPPAFAASRFGDPFTRAELLFEAIAGQGARLPSQRRYEARAKSTANGIILTVAEMNQLDRLDALGLNAVD